MNDKQDKIIDLLEDIKIYAGISSFILAGILGILLGMGFTL